MEEWACSVWIVGWQEIIPASCLVGCIGTEEVCVCTVGACGFFWSVFLCIGQIDTLKATYNSEEVQSVVVDCSTDKSLKCLKRFLLSQQNGRFKVWLFPLLLLFFAFKCVFSVNSVSVWQCKWICVCAIQIKSKIEWISVSTHCMCLCVYDYECTVSDGSSLSVGMFIIWCDLDFQPPTDC